MMPLLMGFFFLVLLITLYRGYRRKRDRIQKRAESSKRGLDFTRKPSDDFHDQIWLPLCDKIDSAITKTGVSLSEEQRRRIWRSRAPLVLEVLLREIEAAQSPDEVSQLLQSLPPGMNRPDPTRWCAKSTGIRSPNK